MERKYPVISSDDRRTVQEHNIMIRKHETEFRIFIYWHSDADKVEPIGTIEGALSIDGDILDLCFTHAISARTVKL